MSDFEQRLRLFAIELFKVDAIKFGEFKTKVGLMTPVYCDLRVIVSYPDLLENLSDLISEHLKQMGPVDIICGVPYTALPIATVVSIKSKIPMVMRRKEAKDYGTKKLIEGNFKAGDKCLIVEDVVTSGSSILETVKDLTNSGVKCDDAIVLLNREQGGAMFLSQNGIKMHALLTLTQLMRYLKDAKCIDQKVVDTVTNYLAQTQLSAKDLTKSAANRLVMSYEARAKVSHNPLAAKIFNLMAKKQSNLCLAADLTDATAILNLAEQVGPHIVLLKTHIDIVNDFHPNFIKHLKTIAETHNFILFEDRKFADIGKTVEAQYSKGTYQISQWANLVTAHSVTGRGVLDAIKQSEGLKDRGVFLLAETSAAGSLIDQNYTKSTLKLAKDYPDLITGIVGQNRLFVTEPGWIQLTPGVQLDSIGDSLSQQYNTPEFVVLEKGADIAVVGRGITQAPEPGEAALKYKKLLWAAYKKRVGQ